MNGPSPVLPVWAPHDLPEPDPGETYRDYVTRLGFDAHELLDGLTERTAVVANIRLVHALADRYPMAWQKHIELFVGRFRPPPPYNGNGHMSQSRNGHPTTL